MALVGRARRAALLAAGCRDRQAERDPARDRRHRRRPDQPRPARRQRRGQPARRTSCSTPRWSASTTSCRSCRSLPSDSRSGTPRPTSRTCARACASTTASALDAEDVAYTFRSFLDTAFLSPRKGAYAQLAVGRRRGTAHGRLPPEGAVRVVPGQPRDGHRAVRHAAGRAGPRRRRPVPLRADAVGRPRRARAQRRATSRARRRNAGVVLRVIPDDTMRGLELRTGAIDLVINDIAPDIVRTLQREGRVQVVTAPGLDYAYVGMNLRDPLLRDVRVRRALGLAVDTSAIIEHLRRGLAVPATGIIPPMSWAHAADLRPTPYDPVEAAPPARRGRLSRSRWRRARAAPAADPQDLDRGVRAAAGRRHPAGPRARRRRRGGADARVRHAVCRRAQGQLPAVHAAVGGRHRPRHAAPRVPLVADAAGGLQSRLLQRSGRRCADRPGHHDRRPGACDARSIWTCSGACSTPRRT